MSYYLEVLKKYAVFSGRARRKEYWMYILFYMIFAIVAAVIDNVAGLTFKGIGYGPIYLVYVLAFLLPTLAVLVRRLHDLGKSGGWFFISFIPLIGGIWMLVLMCTAGTNGSNVYGEDPKL